MKKLNEFIWKTRLLIAKIMICICINTIFPYVIYMSIKAVIFTIACAPGYRNVYTVFGGLSVVFIILAILGMALMWLLLNYIFFMWNKK